MTSPGKWAAAAGAPVALEGGMRGRVSGRRRAAGLAIAVVGLPLLTALLTPIRSSVAVGSILLVYLLAVVLIAVVGGIGPALLAALASFLLVNWFLTPPFNTFSVASRDAAIDLVVFVLVAALVSVTVEVGARHREAAERHRLESRLISELGSAEIGGSSLPAVLERVRTVFGMDTVLLLDPASPGAPLATAGQPPVDEPALRVRTVNDLELVAHGPSVFAEDRRLFGVLADLAARAWEGKQLAEQAAYAQQLAETDRIRSALLTALSHDLRTPLAGIKAAVSSLRQQDIPWTEQERDDLLATVEESADRLTALITNLLAMSRIQAGALSVQLRPVTLDEVVGRALIGTPPNVYVDVPEDLPLVRADAALLERVVANLVDNALRYSPNGSPVQIDADVTSGPASQRAGRGTPHARLRVKDHGPGIPPSQWGAVFAPFQRLGDQDSTTGIGLGLAIARGFTEAMGGQLTPSETAGGGLTMTIELPVAP